MEATKCARIMSRPRTPLETVIPRNTPYSVEVDISSICNFKCKFCFHSDVKKIKESGVKFGAMDMSLYKKIINDMKGFKQKPSKLNLCQFGEPFLNKNIAEMIKYAHDSDVADRIETITNGSLLNKELNRELVNAGLSRINISVESLSDEGYQDVTGNKIDFEKYVKNIRDFYNNRGDCFVHIKLIDLGNLSENNKDFFYETFGSISDEVFIENAVPIWEGTIVNENIINELGVYGQPSEYKHVCPLIFTRMTINYDGIVSLCCVDWKRDEVIGDSKTESLSDIWNGSRLHNIQLKHLNGERQSMELCKDCTLLSTATIDNVDSFRGDILDRMGYKV